MELTSTGGDTISTVSDKEQRPGGGLRVREGARTVGQAVTQILGARSLGSLRVSFWDNS